MKGKGLMKKHLMKTNVIRCNKIYFRPIEVDHLKGDYKKANKLLKWKPKYI